MDPEKVRPAGGRLGIGCQVGSGHDPRSGRGVSLNRGLATSRRRLLLPRIILIIFAGSGLGFSPGISISVQVCSAARLAYRVAWLISFWPVAARIFLGLEHTSDLPSDLSRDNSRVVPGWNWISTKNKDRVRRRSSEWERERERGRGGYRRLQRWQSNFPANMLRGDRSTVPGIVVRFNHAPSAILRSTLGHVSAFPSLIMRASCSLGIHM